MNMRDDNGYSMLELLVALALTAVIATMMVQTTRQLHPLRQIQARYEVQEVAERLSGVITNDIGSALNLPLLGEETRQPLIGAADRIRFVAVVKTGFASSGLREVTYWLERDPSGVKRLVRTIALRRFGNLSDSTTQTDYLFDDIRDITFAYLGLRAAGGAHWQNEWDNAESLPTAIRIGLKVADDQTQTETSAVSLARGVHF